MFKYTKKASLVKWLRWGVLSLLVVAIVALGVSLGALSEAESAAIMSNVADAKKQITVISFFLITLSSCFLLLSTTDLDDCFPRKGIKKGGISVAERE
jgi:hypothetical protein